LSIAYEHERKETSVPVFLPHGQEVGQGQNEEDKACRTKAHCVESCQSTLGEAQEEVINCDDFSVSTYRFQYG
jgi:hypothetical protein